MKKIIAVVVLFCSFGANAQTESLATLGCNTVATPDQLNEIYAWVKENSDVAFKGTGIADSIPVSVHIVGNNAGAGYYNLEHLFSVICELNQRYIPVDMYFYIKWPIQYINNTSYYQHNNASGSQMMAQNNVANTVNIYFVDDPNGACGYYTYGQDAIAIKKSCSAPNSTTVVHEIGHYMGLAHTFSGWENGATPANPEKVTRGFGANCSTAGDGFCDTEADFQGARWSCPYSGNKLDQTGTAYQPDSSLYMGYATDACMTRFSTQQIARIRSVFTQYRQNLLTGSHTPYSTLSDPNIVYPVDSVYSNYKKIVWKKVPGAEYYHIKVTHNTIASFVFEEKLVSDTFINLSYGFADQQKYKLIINPVMNSNTCGTHSVSKTFTYTNGTTQLGIGDVISTDYGVSIFPNPADGFISVTNGSLGTGKMTLRVRDVRGALVAFGQYNVSGNEQTQTLPLSGLQSGIYTIEILQNDFRKVSRFVIR